MDIPFLKDIFVILALAVAVAIVCHRIRVPAVVGLLITGVIAGPNGLRLVDDIHGVELLAETGVILLLFTIGIEFSLGSLRRIWRQFIVGGALQVSLTVAGAFALLRWLGIEPALAVFLGCAAALSSTAIVLRLLQQRVESAAPHGRMVLGVLIFQDIIVVAMMLATPILAGRYGGAPLTAVGLFVLKGAAIAAITWLSARWVVPKLLEQIARTGSNELFLLAVGLVCFAVAWLTSLMGLSLALGAFIAGLIVSESEFSQRALGTALPFRDTFTSFFFVSVGMLLDIRYVAGFAPVLLAIVAAVVVLKALAGSVAALIVGLPFRLAVLVGFALAQVGEFSLVLAATGTESGLLDDESFQRLLAVVVVTMALTPFLLAASSRFADTLGRLPMPGPIRAGRFFAAGADSEVQRDHIVIAGYGVIGASLATSAHLVDIPYVVVEMNLDTVRRQRENGLPIFYGDATQAAALEKAGIEHARVLAITIPDAAGVRRTLELARRLNPHIHIVARTRYVQEMEPLYRLGANEVVPEELEAAVEIFSAALREYSVPADTIEAYGGRTRTRHYQAIRGKDD